MGTSLFFAIVVSSVLRSRPGPTIIEGHIDRGADDHTGRYFEPQQGLVVTNDRNASTSITDQNGRFRLVLPHTGPDEFINIAVHRVDAVVLK